MQNQNESFQRAAQAPGIGAKAAIKKRQLV